VSNRPIRVRYAPSPTGEQHIGGIRTALFNYLYARKAGGAFIIRIEDTDVARSRPEYERSLYRDLEWLGLDWDEGPDKGGPCGPYRQSERAELYRQVVLRLLEEGKAYFCYCSPQELQAERERAIAEGRPPRYSGRCRDPKVREQLAKEGRPPAVRFLVPEGERIVFRDLIRGEVSFLSDDLGDFVIYRAEDTELHGGRALYNLAAVVDDHAMGISDVLRGEEHLPNTPRQILLYRALGYPVPRFGHLSLILSPDGSKMSKRLGDISIAHYREEGYLPEAIVAYVATLGWAPGRKAERLNLEDLVERFDIRRLSANPSIFDPQRLLWFNKRRLQREDPRRLGELLRPRLEEAFGSWERSAGTAYGPEDWYQALVLAAREEAATVKEMVALSEFAFVEQVHFTPEALEALREESAPLVLQHCYDTLGEEDVQSPEAASAYFHRLREHFAELAGRKVMFPVRAALTGSLRGPSLGVVAALLGFARCRTRLQAALHECASS